MSKQINIGLNNYEDLLGGPVESDNSIQEIDLSKLKPFKDHPFSLHNDEEMQKLSTSIKVNGLAHAILVRSIEDKQFTHEIVSGHNRVEASKLAGLMTIRCDVQDLDDNQAVIKMVESNLMQRTVIKPSEKAKAYKMRLDAIKSQGKRNDLTSRQLGEKLTSVEIVSHEVNDCERQIHRFVRLNKLSPNLLQKVDDKKLALTSAVELSYLNDDQQAEVFDVLDAEEKYGIPLRIAGKLRGVSEHGELTRNKIESFIAEGIKKSPKDFKISMEYINKYFPEDATPSDISETIDKALERYFNNSQDNDNTLIQKTR